MEHTHTPAHNVLPFPLHRARPPLAVRVLAVRDAARADAARGLWDSLPEGNGDRISCADLCDMLPPLDAPAPTGTLVLAIAAADFAVLGLFAIQTGQWMRPDLLEALMGLQSAAAQTLALHAPASAERMG
jgi:hypothetical protein